MCYNVTHLLLINGAGSGTAQLERLNRVAQGLERQIYPSRRVMNFTKRTFYESDNAEFAQSSTYFIDLASIINK